MGYLNAPLIGVIFAVEKEFGKVPQTVLVKKYAASVIRSLWSLLGALS